MQEVMSGAVMFAPVVLKMSEVTKNMKIDDFECISRRRRGMEVRVLQKID